MKDTSPSLLLAMSAPPYWHCGRTVLKRSLDILVALLPAIVMAIVNWGLPAARVMALSVVVCVLVEALCCKIMGRRVTVDDLTAVITGLLFSFLLPAGSSWWVVVIGAVCAMLFGKMLFGGLGNNPLSTPLIGWAILYVSFPLHMDANLVQLFSQYVDPLVRLKYFGAADANGISIVQLLLGHQISALGAGQVGALLLGGLFLLARGTIRWQIVLGFLLGVLVPFAFVQMTAPETSGTALFQLCTGSVVLCAFFSPPNPVLLRRILLPWFSMV